jgi:hypothetical protein
LFNRARDEFDLRRFDKVCTSFESVASGRSRIRLSDKRRNVESPTYPCMVLDRRKPQGLHAWRYGTKVLELAKGKTAIEVGSLDELIPTRLKH